MIKWKNEWAAFTRCISLTGHLSETSLLHWIPEVPRKTENGTSGSARYPVVLRIESEASIPILGYSVIGQILTGDPQLYNTVFWRHFN